MPPHRWSNPRYLALLRIDAAALRRGRVEGEELCEIAGIGPVPVSVARTLLGEAIVKLVITNGVDVANVTHLGRGPTTAQKVALLWANPTCTADGCPRRRIEYDHQKPWAETRHTRLDELDPLCTYHHDLKTRLGWALVPGKGKRAFVPPDDPDTPVNSQTPSASSSPDSLCHRAADGLGAGTYGTADSAIDATPAIAAAHVGARRPMTVTSSSRNRLEASDSRSREWDWHLGLIRRRLSAMGSWTVDQAGGFRLGRRTYASRVRGAHPSTHGQRCAGFIPGAPLSGMRNSRAHFGLPTIEGRMADRRLRRRVDSWLARRNARVGGFNPWQVFADALHASAEHRVTGLAAEMAFFASLALIPFTFAFGAVFAYVEQWTSPDSTDDVEEVIAELMRIILGPDLVSDVAEPYVRAQLNQARGGLAIAGLVFGLWLASRVFLLAVHALDLANDVVEQRSALRRRAIWRRWPSRRCSSSSCRCSSRYSGHYSEMPVSSRTSSASATHSPCCGRPVGGRSWPSWSPASCSRSTSCPGPPAGWRRSMPGAIVAMLVWIAVAAGFRAYLATGRTSAKACPPRQKPPKRSLRSVEPRHHPRIVVWVFLSSVAVLFGGEINAAIDRRRQLRQRAGEPR